MTTVILLVWLAGADGAAPAAQPAPAHLHPAPAPHGVHGSCNDCCDKGGHHLFGRLRGWFHRSCDDGCKESCRSGHPLFHARHQDGCCNEGGHKFFGFLHRWRHHDCNPSDCCEEGRGHKLLSRFHGIFRRHDDCCDAPAAPAAIHPHPPGKPLGEPIKAAPKKEEPKKLPKTENKAALTPQPPAGLILETPGSPPQR